MSHSKNRKTRTIARNPVTETREPNPPRSDSIQVELTGDDELECLVATIHGVKHYLHTSTACALAEMLIGNLIKWDKDAREHGEKYRDILSPELIELSESARKSLPISKYKVLLNDPPPVLKDLLDE